MEKLKNIALEIINNLDKKNIQANPKNYEKEFCKEIKRLDMSDEQCELFNKALQDLSREELNLYNIQNINSLYDIVKILLQRPSSLELIQQTDELSQIMNNVEDGLNDALITSGNSYNNIYKLKENIDKFNDNEDLLRLKKKLLNATNVVCNELSLVNKMLIKERKEVFLMEKKINTLQEDLNKYKQESTIDHLTGLLTRRQYDIDISRFEQRYIRNDEDFAIIFIDLDYFKKINDNYGHAAGDFVLKTFGEILNKITRKTDIVARYGGEEFICIVKYKQEKELIDYIKRIKSIVTLNKFKFNDLKINVTFSAGVQLRSIFDTYEEAIKDADKLLYNAKRDGRDKIILWSNKVI